MKRLRSPDPVPVARRRRISGALLLAGTWSLAGCASPGGEGSTGATPATRGAASSDVSFEAAVRRDLAASAATGAVFAVVGADGLRSIEAVGHVDRERTVPMSEDYLFHLGDWGQLFLASVAVTLEEEGVLALGAPIGEVVPTLSEGMGRLSLEQLLLETGGLDDSPLQGRREGEPLRALPPEEELRLLTDRVLMLAPGALRSPSRHHWLLAGHVVEAAAGMSLEGIVDRVLGTPVGLRHTRFASTDAVPSGALPGFQGSRTADGPYAPAPHPNPAVLQPQERIWSTAEDLARIVGQWLAEPTHLVELARPRVRDPEDPDHGVLHGLAFEVAPDGGWTARGGGPGHSVVLRVLPAEGVAVLSMSNGRSSPMTRAHALLEDEARAGSSGPLPGLADLALPEAPPLALERIVQPLPAYAGLYRNGSEVFRLVVHEGRLAADPGLPEPLPIRAGAGGRLEAHLDDGRIAMVIHLFRDAEGHLLAVYRGVAFRWEGEP